MSTLSLSPATTAPAAPLAPTRSRSTAQRLAMPALVLGLLLAVLLYAGVAAGTVLLAAQLLA